MRTYTDHEIPERLTAHGLTEWYLEDGWIRRKYNTDGWPQTLMAVNAVGYLCEAAWHHADLAVTWGKLWVHSCTTMANHGSSSANLYNTSLNNRSLR